MSFRNRRLSDVFSEDEKVDGIPDVFHVRGGAGSRKEGSQAGEWTHGILNGHCVLYRALPPAATQQVKLQCLFFPGMLFIREIYFIQFYFIQLELSPLLSFQKHFISCYLQFMLVNYLLEQQVVVFKDLCKMHGSIRR